jgi:TolB-like protein
MKQLLSELRRRNVFRVAAAYLVVGWLVLQVVGAIEDAAGLPGWVDGFTLVVLITGLPIVLFIAWAFEMTPEGMQKTAPADGETGFRPLGGTDFILIGLMVLVLGVIGFQILTRGDGSPEPQAAELTTEPASTPVLDVETVEPPVTEASIAVMPFADLSPSGDQQYFSDGIAEELLNALAQFPDLQVAARTSAFSFRGDDVDLRDVGDALNVAHVLEGSVRMSDDRVRITAQLIRVSDGFHLWSETYERTLTDVFAIQDEIVVELSRVLQVRLGVGAGVGRSGSTNVDPLAYQSYLQGLALWADRDDDSNRRNAYRAFRRATELDPEFADAWAALGVSIILSSGTDLTGLPKREANRLAREALGTALSLDPDNARAHAGSASFYVSKQLDIERATFHARTAVELAPNAAFAHYALTTVLAYRGDLIALEQAADRAVMLDPLNETVHRVTAQYLATYGRGRNMVGVGEACEGFAHRRACLIGAVDAAIHAGDEPRVIRILDAIRQIETADGPAPWAVDIGFAGAAEFYSANAALRLDMESDHIELLEEFALDRANLDLWSANDVAHFGYTDLALDALFEHYDTGWGVGLVWFISDGAYEFPDALRRHPRFHELWTLPGMPELAEVRRANGITAGLPLPMEGRE